MQWHHTITKRILKGVIFLLFPIIVLVFVVGKAVSIVQKMILPIQKYLPDGRLLGMPLLTVVSILLILFLCYLAGILSEKKRVKSLILKLEENLLVFIPGYALIKSRAGDAISETDDSLRSVLLVEPNGWRPGIEVDRHSNGNCTVFFPTPPEGKSGILKVVHQSKLKSLDIPVSTLLKMVRKYGQGSASWVNTETIPVK